MLDDAANDNLRKPFSHTDLLRAQYVLADINRDFMLPRNEFGDTLAEIIYDGIFAGNRAPLVEALSRQPIMQHITVFTEPLADSPLQSQEDIELRKAINNYGITLVERYTKEDTYHCIKSPEMQVRDLQQKLMARGIRHPQVLAEVEAYENLINSACQLLKITPAQDVGKSQGWSR